MVLAAKSCDFVLFCLMLLLMLHGQVNFTDSCAFNVEKWAEFFGKSEGKVLQTTNSSAPVEPTKQPPNLRGTAGTQ